jgi:succinate dehydrogenase/fumarate reductase cytochrome b subunit
MIIFVFIIFAIVTLFTFNGLSVLFCDKRNIPENYQKKFIRTINFWITLLLVSSYFDLLISLGKPL